MTLVIEPEKGAAARLSSSSSSSSLSSSPRLGASVGGAEEKEATPSLASHISDTSDPLSPLEHALTTDLRTEAEHEAARAELALTQTRTRTSIGSHASRPPDFEVVFDSDDSENPRNWPLWYRSWIIFCVSFSTWVVVLYSTAYTAATPGMMAEYNVTSTSIVTLGLTTYLLGLAAGSVVVAPLSELYGRRTVYLVCVFIFVLLIIPCGLATSLAELIIVRFFGALFGSAMVSNSPGTVVDVSSQKYLALAMSLWSIAPLNGPVTGPLIGGFVYQYLGWRWDNWIPLILGGVAFLLLLTVKETYAPTILKRKAARMRKELDDDRWWCRYEENTTTIDLLKVNLSRPFVLAATEPILWFFNVWISVIYGILYLCFIAYPVVFVQYRGWTPGLSGLAFLGIGVGTLLAIFLEPLWRRIINAHPRDPTTGTAIPEATAAVMSLGALLTPVGQLGFSWTCLPTSIPYIAPIAFGVPFGMGNTLCFIYGTNYLAAAYGNHAASALSGNTVMRSIFGAALPLAGPAMYASLTPQWAGTLLGLLEVVLIPIPIIFYYHGDKIRARSRVIKQMREDAARNEGRAAKHAARVARRAAAAAAKEGEMGKEMGKGGDVEAQAQGASGVLGELLNVL
ncbi:major facilitator superfamily domain-containing protein [Cercophora newfieldiana]|uniref:Major facilitator superfamily domain-containing protein n=1 Tax=Cercophora newfieldiana TaxID=92897 RepID=A0AA39YBA5_9PEZI|nr:major facilitator superfamily domain-containing protein [Cercophora newfieldiana]